MARSDANPLITGDRRPARLRVRPGWRIITGLALYLAREPILLAIGDFLVVEDTLQPADLIHVVSGEEDRLDYGVQLYLQGFGRRLFFTGDGVPDKPVIRAELYQEEAISQGVPPADIYLDGGPIDSTYSEAVRLKQISRICTVLYFYPCALSP